MKIRIMALLCIAAITISCNAMIQESDVTKVVDESTGSEQKFRAFLSNGEVYWVQHTQGNYNCQLVTPVQRGPVVMARLTDKTPDESRALFLAIQSLYTRRQ